MFIVDKAIHIAFGIYFFSVIWFLIGILATKRKKISKYYKFSYRDMQEVIALKLIQGYIENNRLNKVTLGGCIIEKVNQTVIISKEH